MSVRVPVHMSKRMSMHVYPDVQTQEAERRVAYAQFELGLCYHDGHMTGQVAMHGPWAMSHGRCMAAWRYGGIRARGDGFLCDVWLVRWAWVDPAMRGLVGVKFVVLSGWCCGLYGGMV